MVYETHMAAFKPASLLIKWHNGCEIPLQIAKQFTIVNYCYHLE